VIDYLEKHPKNAGLYFLDYNLNHQGMDGKGLAEEIRKYDPRGFIVFITSDAKAHRLTFQHKVEALDYIVKGEPDVSERVRECINDANEKYTAKATALQDNSVFKLADDVKGFFGKSSLAKDSNVAIENDKILYFATEPDIKHTIIIYTTNGRITSPGSLKQVEASMDSRFFRCQNNLIVNLDKVTGIDPIQHTATLEGNLTVDLVAKKIKAFNNVWIAHNQK